MPEDMGAAAQPTRAQSMALLNRVGRAASTAKTTAATGILGVVGAAAVAPQVLGRMLTRTLGVARAGAGIFDKKITGVTKMFRKLSKQDKELVSAAREMFSNINSDLAAAIEAAGQIEIKTPELQEQVAQLKLLQEGVSEILDTDKEVSSKQMAAVLQGIELSKQQIDQLKSTAEGDEELRAELSSIEGVLDQQLEVTLDFNDNLEKAAKEAKIENKRRFLERMSERADVIATNETLGQIAEASMMGVGSMLGVAAPLKLLTEHLGMNPIEILVKGFKGGFKLLSMATSAGGWLLGKIFRKKGDEQVSKLDEVQKATEQRMKAASLQHDEMMQASVGAAASLASIDDSQELQAAIAQDRWQRELTGRAPGAAGVGAAGAAGGLGVGELIAGIGGGGLLARGGRGLVGLAGRGGRALGGAILGVASGLGKGALALLTKAVGAITLPVVGAAATIGLSVWSVFRSVQLRKDYQALDRSVIGVRKQTQEWKQELWGSQEALAKFNEIARRGPKAMQDWVKVATPREAAAAFKDLQARRGALQAELDAARNYPNLSRSARLFGDAVEQGYRTANEQAIIQREINKADKQLAAVREKGLAELRSRYADDDKRARERGRSETERVRAGRAAVEGRAPRGERPPAGEAGMREAIDNVNSTLLQLINETKKVNTSVRDSAVKVSPSATAISRAPRSSGDPATEAIASGLNLEQVD